MSSKLTVLGVVTALLISGSLAFVAVPSIAVGNDGAGNEGDGDGAHEISECTVIDESGTYTITNDITNESADPCIEIRSSDVVVDGNGHTVDGVDKNGTGIQALTTNNVTVRNLTVTRFDRGVEAASSAELTVVDSRIDDNREGVTILSFVDLTVKDSTVSGNERSGIVVEESNVTVVDSEIVDNGESGVAAATFSWGTVRDSLLAGNDVGLYTSDSEIATEDNTIRNNAEAGIVAETLRSTNDVVEGNGVGIRGNNDIWLDGTVVRNNTDAGVSLLPYRPNETFARITDSTITDNGGDGIHVDADNRDLSEPVSEFTAEIHGSTIVDNDGLGVNNTEPTVVNATGNDWGSEDGPSSADDPDAPFEDPVTGRLADGEGDEVSEHPEKPGVSNVHFTNQPPEAAYQFDVAVGEVIEDLGEDDDAFYGMQGRLLEAKTALSNGDVTSTYNVPAETAHETVDGAQFTYDAVTYDEATGEVTVTISLSEDADSEAKVTLAAYELPADDTEFVRAHADGQELVAHETVTVAPGESVTITIDVDEDDD